MRNEEEIKEQIHILKELSSEYEAKCLSNRYFESRIDGLNWVLSERR